MGGGERGRRRLRGLALAVLLLALPWLLPQRYFLRVVDLGLVYAVLALGLQLLVGSAGQLSLGHAAFYGTGAYTSAILVRKLGLPVELSFVAGGVVAALLGLTLVPILRLRGNELAVATLGFGVIVHAVILNEEWLTEGPFGMMKIPPFQLGPLVFNTEFRFYFLGLAVVAGTYLAFRRLARSRFGRALEAIRQSEEAAVTSGINPVLYKSKVFVIAAFTAGLAGPHVTRRSGGLAALAAVSLTTGAGGGRGLIAPTGAGKPTLVNGLGGVPRPTAGSISFSGGEIAGSPPYRIARLGIRRTF